MFERNFEFVVVIHIIDRGFLLAKIKKKKKKGRNKKLSKNIW